MFVDAFVRGDVERGAEADVVVEQARGNPVGVGDEDDVAAENRDVAEGFGVAVEMLDARADAGMVGFDVGGVGESGGCAQQSWKNLYLGE